MLINDTRYKFTPSRNGWHRNFRFSKGGKGDIVCAKKFGEGESDVRSITETFRRNSTGSQSRLVELGKQPEASLAWGRADPHCEA
jgi:hypothetical protein